MNVNRVTETTRVEIREGNKVFRMERGGAGVTLTVGKASIRIPNGSVGAAVVAELGTMVGEVVAPKAKRTRRTKAQIEAERAAAGEETNVGE